MIKKIKKIFTNSKVTFTFGIIFGLLLAAGGVYAATLANSKDVTYDNSNSTLTSTNVQDAIDELYGKIPTNLLSIVLSKYYNGTKTSVTTAGGEAITQVASEGLMQDSFGNIRYYGTDPNNYVTFNGEDAGWRIIGVFDTEDENGNVSKRIKLIRTEAIGNYAYDSKLDGVGTSVSGSGSNDWTDSRLMMLLNSGYENPSSLYAYEGSLYWNRRTGTCYAGKSEGTTSCDFTSTGLTSQAQSQIDKVKYYLGGTNTAAGYADDYYNFERGTTVYSGHQTFWIGYIGVMYLSDYTYATDLSICTKDGSSYDGDSTNCGDKDWLLDTSRTAWTLSPYSDHPAYVFHINPTGGIHYYNNAYHANVVRPVAYLKSNLKISGGTGSQSNPYVIL